MIPSLWALLFSVLLSATAKAQLPPLATQTNTLAANSPANVEEIRAKAEKGDAAAQFVLGLKYTIGDGVTKDYAEAVKWFRKGAEQGHADAQNMLGSCYYFGSNRDGVAPNYAEAVKWYRKAADQGDARSQSDLGSCYYNGNGVAQDYAEAVKWFRKAAEQGDAAAQGILGSCYYNGNGVGQDCAEAIKWLRKAADQGDTAAELNLALCYKFGKGVAQDQGEFLKRLRNLADRGDAVAQNELGILYDKGDGVPQDYAEAAKWYRKAADQGEALAQCNLSRCYLKGDGVVQDYAAAVKWYRKAADQGDATGQYGLGYCYEHGQGVPQNTAEAVILYRRAADQGNAYGQHGLGFHYAFGDGVIKDYVQAYKWVNLASAQGLEVAKQFLPILELQMSRNQIAEAQRLAREFKPGKAAETAPFLPGATTVDSFPTSSGTGFFITDDGFFVTAAHVVIGAAQFRLITSTGLLTARLVKLDSANDLALLKADGHFSILPIASSRGVKLGSTVATVGFPNTGMQGFAPKLAKGEIASLTGSQDDPRYFQISVAVQPGNSGGALVDERGNVVGVVSAKLDAATTLATTGALPENVNYAVKSSFLLGFLESVPEIAAKLKEPGTKEETFEDVVRSAEKAAVLLLVY